MRFFFCSTCSSPFFLTFDHRACLVAGVKSGKGAREVDISKITPPTSPPSRTFGLSPPHVDPGKRKEDDMEVEQVGQGGGDGVGAGDGGDGGRAGDDGDVKMESSEATPHHTIYTKVVRGSRGGGASGTHHSPEYEHVQGGSRDTHNPACANLPHTPRWNLTRDSRMTELSNCREFFSLSLPPAERLFRKRRNWMDLLDNHIHVGLMGEDTLEFEAAKKAFAEEREKFNNEKKGLSWWVADAEEKLAKEKQFNTNKQKEWEVACERTNKELQTQRETIMRLSGEKTKISDEAESKASEILVEEVTADCKWLLVRYMYELGEVAYDHDQKEGYAEGRSAAEAKEALKSFDLYKTDCATRYAEKRQEFESLKFAIVKAAGKLSRKPDGIALLKKALGDGDPQGEDVGSNGHGVVFGMIGFSCVFDPAVHLVVTSLGGLQRFLL
ncbi:hypothetical protein Hanom_Chr09g00771131 [Helianthus anomalus]